MAESNNNQTPKDTKNPIDFQSTNIHKTRSYENPEYFSEKNRRIPLKQKISTWANKHRKALKISAIVLGVLIILGIITGIILAIILNNQPEEPAAGDDWTTSLEDVNTEAYEILESADGGVESAISYLDEQISATSGILVVLGIITGVALAIIPKARQHHSLERCWPIEKARLLLGFFDAQSPRILFRTRGLFVISCYGPKKT